MERLFQLCGVAIGWYSGVLFHDVRTQGGSYILPISVMVLGMIIVILAMYGCLGACKENYAYMMIYIVLMTILLILQIAVVIGLFCYKDAILVDTSEQFDKRWEDGLNNKTHGYDTYQKKYKCCGKDSPSDYTRGLPPSCCDESVIGICTMDKAYQKGCKTEFIETTDNLWIVVQFMGVVLAILEFILISFGCCLAKHFRDGQYSNY